MLAKKLTEISIKQKGLLLVVLPIVFEVVFVSGLLAVLYYSEAQRARETHLRAIVTELHETVQTFYESGLALAAYQATRSESLLLAFEQLQRVAVRRVQEIKTLVADDPSSAVSLGTYDRHARHVLDVSRRIRDYLTRERQGKLPEAEELAMLADVNAAMRGLLSTSRQLIAEQTSLQSVLASNLEHSRMLLIAAIAGGLIGHVVLAAFLARFFSSSIERRLSVISDNSVRLTRGEELQPRLRGEDEISQLDSTFHKMAQNLREADQRKSEMFAILSHDIRGPITSFAMMFRLLIQGSFGPVPQAALDRLRKAESTNRFLFQLVENFLDLERLTQGSIEPGREPATVSEVVEAALDAVGSLAELKEITVEVVDEVQVTFLADRRMLIQVVLNLLGNAIKFSPERGTIRIGARISGTRLRLQVEDEGPGVPPGFASQIFERFGQVPGTEQRSKGTGLGLAVCKKVAELHGGAVGMDADREVGSCFWFEIPFVSCSEEPVSTPLG